MGAPTPTISRPVARSMSAMVSSNAIRYPSGVTSWGRRMANTRQNSSMCPDITPPLVSFSFTSAVGMTVSMLAALASVVALRAQLQQAEAEVVVLLAETSDLFDSLVLLLDLTLE